MPVAAEVLELCDGERSLDEIVGALAARYAAPISATTSTG